MQRLTVDRAGRQHRRRRVPAGGRLQGLRPHARIPTGAAGGRFLVCGGPRPPLQGEHERTRCFPKGHQPTTYMKGKKGSMSTITTKDGTQIYYNDWGTGQPVVFSHGWPLSADAFEDQMFFLASRGYRCIAHDRRGHGRSSQPWSGNDWTPTPTTSRSWSKNSTSKTPSTSATPPAAAKSPATLAATAPSASPRRC